MKFGCQQWQRSEEQLAINANRGAQQEFSVSIKVSKKILPFHVEIFNRYELGLLTSECYAEKYLLGLAESDRKIRLRLLVFLGIRLHPKTSDSRLHHPGFESSFVIPIFVSYGHFAYAFSNVPFAIFPRMVKYQGKRNQKTKIVF